MWFDQTAMSEDMIYSIYNNNNNNSEPLSPGWKHKHGIIVFYFFSFFVPPFCYITLSFPFPFPFITWLWFDGVCRCPAHVCCFCGCVTVVVWFSGSETLSLELSSVLTGSDVDCVESQQIDTESELQYSRASPQNDSSPKDPISMNPQLSDPQIRSPLHPSVRPQPQEQNLSDREKMEEKERDGWATFCQIPLNSTDPLQSDLQMSHNQTAGNDTRCPDFPPPRQHTNTPDPAYYTSRHVLCLKTL